MAPQFATVVKAPVANAHSVQKLLGEATALLRPASPTARLDAELLLAHVLGWGRARLLAERDFAPSEAQRAAFSALVQRRQALEPVAYLVGRREFYGLEFAVDPRVLVPRPETELLVELAIARARDLPRRRGPGALRIADVGTGSGAIAVALAVHLPQAQIQAVDISPEALAVARANVERHGVAARVRLLEGSLLAPVEPPLDIVVSNPPYTVLAEVDEGVRLHEPRLALDGGEGGLAVYPRLLEEALAKLAPGGLLLAEIGAWQGEALLALARGLAPEAGVRLHQDLAGRDRVLEVDLG
jgi:release factor glutamine methyltransferase